MKKAKRSAKAPARGPSSSPARRARGKPDPGGANREEVRQQTRRVNVPRHSQRPAERSNQRRSRRP